jgi:hypothetical protein
MKKIISNPVIWCLVVLTAAPLWADSSEPNAGPVFKQEELEQILAPIALYPDSLLSQILMASTYPLEIVQADRWAKQNNDLKGEALAAALERQTWDPSVKSLVNFPEVLSMMSKKLDLTQKIGDAFISQQKDVLEAVQKLRKKAQEEGNLKTSEQQVVTEEQQIIAIEPADEEIVYVPEYDPNVVYGVWYYPAYPPYYYHHYPPRATLYSYGSGVAVGAAWGYAWGHCNWHGGDIDIDVNRNLGLNQNINRGQYAQQYQNRGQFDQNGRGKWQHNAENRKGVAYRNQVTAQKYNRASTADSVKSREAYRGRAQQDRQQLSQANAERYKNSQDVSQRTASERKSQPATRNTQSYSSPARSSAFQDMDGGSSVRNSSNRGQASRQSMSRPSGGGGGRRR